MTYQKGNEVPEKEMWLEKDPGSRVGGEAPHTPPFFSFWGLRASGEDNGKMKKRKQGRVDLACRTKKMPFRRAR